MTNTDLVALVDEMQATLTALRRCASRGSRTCRSRTLKTKRLRAGNRGKRRPITSTAKPFPSWQVSFTTSEAAIYCRFRTPQGLRKAWYAMQVFPLGRRGGRRTLIWARKELDRFLKGKPLKGKKAGGLMLPPKAGPNSEGGRNMNTSTKDLASGGEP